LTATHRRQAFRDKNWKLKNTPRTYKSYDLYWLAHSALEEIAKQNNLTISQAVLYLNEVHERALKCRVGIPKASDLEEFKRLTEQAISFVTASRYIDFSRSIASRMSIATTRTCLMRQYKMVRPTLSGH
jgi:hypothetical protein